MEESDGASTAGDKNASRMFEIFMLRERVEDGPEVEVEVDGELG
jgi:hypothetical protein